ncbi:sugar nucleotide-binding protein [Candidatus Parcubacteria bacterium]|nr:sugar nucleotide-binding protein [Candidatus Parcubacteria bacterium]
MKILMTGGSGLLGSEIKRLDPEIISPSHQEMDITNLSSILSTLEKYGPKVLLHLAAYNNPPEHEKNPELGITTNIIGTANLALACFKNGIKLVHASTDFVYTGPGSHKEEEPLLAPSRFGWSKVGAEASVRMLHDFLILRLDFGPIPFPWPKVYKDHYVSKLYVDEMAPLVLKAAQSSVVGVLNLGGPRVSLEDYAKRTKPEVETILKPEWVPADSSMDVSKMKKELNISDEKELLKH